MTAKDTQNLQLQLQSDDEEVVLETLEKLKTTGNAASISPLLELLASEPTYGITLDILGLLTNMKDPASIDVFMNLFEDSRFKNIRHHLLTVLWSGTFVERGKGYILNVVKMGVDGDFKTLIEAVTVIENLEAPFEEEQLLEGIAICQNFISTKPSDEKLTLVKELKELLTAMDETNTDIDPEYND